MNIKLPPYESIKEPKLIFHPTRLEDRDAHPLRGLVTYGPYSHSLINNVVDPIRLAFIVPHNTRGVINGLLAELKSSHKPRERRAYLIDYPGFSEVFGLNIVPAHESTWIRLPEQLGQDLAKSPSPYLLLAEHLTKAISSLQTNRTAFDVLLIYLPADWQDCFYGGENNEFDLHDYVKAQAAAMAIPTQIVLETSALTYSCRASVMWRLGIALYCKAGGVPWKLAGSHPETAYIGLSYAVRPTESNDPRFVTCCSQVFDSDGAGLEFLTYDTDQAYVERDNPFLSRVDMRKVMARSLALYQRRHAGHRPKRIVVHKSTHFKTEEIAGCFDAFQAVSDIELIHVQDAVSWRGIHIEPPRGATSDKKGMPGKYPIRRGNFMYLGDREVLLWTQGNAPEVAEGKDFFKEGKGIPTPIILRRFAGHGSLEQACWEVLGLTKMDWNNDSLYNRLPVTLSYASVLARTIKRMPNLSSRPYELRYFM